MALYNPPKMETTYMLINRWTVKQIVYDQIMKYYSEEKEQNLNIYETTRWI